MEVSIDWQHLAGVALLACLTVYLASRGDVLDVTLKMPFVSLSVRWRKRRRKR